MTQLNSEHAFGWTKRDRKWRETVTETENSNEQENFDSSQKQQHRQNINLKMCNRNRKLYYHILAHRQSLTTNLQTTITISTSNVEKKLSHTRPLKHLE